jgi:hypothetical protein
MTRRHLQISLALLWLLDGALQCQPSMFTSHFTSDTLAPASHGLPIALAAPLHLALDLVLSHPVLANTVFALTQILLGLALLVRRLSRVGLAASVIWALVVWAFGEGFGGIFTGATLLSGAPGAALLYAVVALLAWPNDVGASDVAPSGWSLRAWCALWLTGAGLQLVGGNNSAMSFTMTLRSAASSAPQWISSIDRHLAGVRFPVWSGAVVVALEVLIALWSLVPGWTRQLSLSIGAVVALTSWLLAEGLGDLTSGQSTDPNSGPLIVLIALAALSAAPRVSRADAPVASWPTTDVVVDSLIATTSH